MPIIEREIYQDSFFSKYNYWKEIMKRWAVCKQKIYKNYKLIDFRQTYV